MKVILETDRLLLRQYVEEDAEAFFKLNSDPEVLRFVPDKRLLNVEQARQILSDHPIADYRKYGFGRGACILNSTVGYSSPLGSAFAPRSLVWAVGISGDHLLHRFLHLVRADISDVGSDRPLVTERIFQFAIAIAPEHVV